MRFVTSGWPGHIHCMHLPYKHPMTWVAAVILIAIAFLVHGEVGHASIAGQDIPEWSKPGSMTLKKVSDVTGSQSEPNFLSNIDCQTLTYRTSADKTMRTGCFTATAFGYLDSDSEMAIFNGTDEGAALLPQSNGQVLVPWPHSLVLIALDTTQTGGSYLRLYKNAMNLQTERDYLGRIIGK